MHATVVALACVLSFILVSIAIFFLWRRITRSARQRRQLEDSGPLPYIEISEADTDGARSVSRQPWPERNGLGGALHPERSRPTMEREPEPEPEILPPQIQPFPFLAIQTQRPTVPRIYRAFAELEEKYRLRVIERGAIQEDEQRVTTPPPGYRSTETISLR